MVIEAFIWALFFCCGSYVLDCIWRDGEEHPTPIKVEERE